MVWVRIAHPDHAFFRAMYTTVYMAVIAQVMGVLLGLVAALMRSSRFAPFRFLSGVYVWLFRGTPVLVQIFFIYYGTNELFGFNVIPNTLNLGLFSLDGAVVAGILALGINEGAYMREIIRAGIDSIDKGQMEAAKSLGMRYGLAMRRIVLPQAARVIVPPLGNEFNNMMKTTSLVFTIGVYEMFADAEQRLLELVPARGVLRRGRVLVPRADDRVGVHPGRDRAQARGERARRGALVHRADAGRLEPDDVGGRWARR